MIPVTIFAGKQVALFGLGGSGLATIAALIAGGAMVAAFDDSEAARLEAMKLGFTVIDLADADWSGFAALILSPGVPLTHPQPHWVVKKAKAAGVEIIGDIELFAREKAKRAPDAPLIAITGTNGKSTTTALIAHLLMKAGHDVQMGGNIGTAVLSLEPPEENLTGKNRVYVLEVSTFQIDLSPSLAPSIGILLNLTPDHLDRHGNFTAYAAIKERMINASRTAIIGADDETCRVIGQRRQLDKPSVMISSSSQLQDGIFADGSMLYLARAGRSRAIIDLAGIGSLIGPHNAQNVAAVIAAVSLLGLDAATIQSGLRSFPGLTHRMEEIGRQGRTLFINDSKATNAESTRWALQAFPDGIFWILGGKAKEGGIRSLSPLFRRIEKAYLIGAAADEFAATLEEHRVPFERSETLERALETASIDAVGSKALLPVVLLSPACASYDQFQNFEARGKRFRELSVALPDFEPNMRGMT